jgi:copper chaperone CopZ
MQDYTLVLTKRKNKNMKNLMITAVLMFAFIGNSNAQDKPKVEEISFKTSAICGMCEERIEDKLNYTKGVVFAELDDETKVLTVKFKTKKLNGRQVKAIVASIGYDAGEVEKNKEAYNNLPKCCKAKGFCADE